MFVNIKEFIRFKINYMSLKIYSQIKIVRHTENSITLEINPLMQDSFIRLKAEDNIIQIILTLYIYNLTDNGVYTNKYMISKLLLNRSNINTEAFIEEITKEMLTGLVSYPYAYYSSVYNLIKIALKMLGWIENE